MEHKPGDKPTDAVILLSDVLEGAELAAARNIVALYTHRSIAVNDGQWTVRDAVNVLGRRPQLSMGELIESLVALTGALYHVRMRGIA